MENLNYVVLSLIIFVLLLLVFGSNDRWNP